MQQLGRYLATKIPGYVILEDAYRNLISASQGRVAKLADALDLGSSSAMSGGSSPLSPTIYISAERRFSFWGSFLTSDHTWITTERIRMVVANCTDKGKERQYDFVYTEGVRSSSLLPPKSYEERISYEIRSCFWGRQNRRSSIHLLFRRELVGKCSEV